MEKWLLKDILHSGRKGERLTPVNDPKYYDIIGWNVWLDIKDIKAFEELRFYFKGHPMYDWWTTTAAIEARIEDDKTLYFESVNTIYVFERVEEEKKDDAE